MQPPGRCLPDDGDERRAIHIGVGHAGHQVGRAGPERAEAYPGFAGQPAVGVGHKRGGLFVAAKNELDLAIQQRDHDVGVFLAGHPKNVGHALVFEALNE